MIESVFALICFGCTVQHTTITVPPTMIERMDEACENWQPYRLEQDILLMCEVTDD